MLEYRLDDLQWAEFEALCQALLKATLGVGVESWGGSGDWGIDAYCRASLRYPGSEVQDGPFQFQVKFVHGANAAGAQPHVPLTGAVKRECGRIRQRGQAQPQVYSLLTNVVVSAKLRATVESMIRDALPACTTVVIHGGNDICSWLHKHHDIVRMYPQLLTHRNLSELVARAFLDESQKVTPVVATQLSAALKRAKKRARAASRRHAVGSALNLWNAVSKQAISDGDKTEEISARLEMLVVLAWDDPDEALALVDKCLEEAKAVDLGNTRARLLQLIGEVHRVGGHRDQARGFLMCALECARAVRSKLDEGFALLSLSLLDSEDNEDGDRAKSSELVGLAYDAFSAQLATGEVDTKEAATDGYAQCHCCRADLLRHASPEDALAELTKALAIFRSLGDRCEWITADTLLRRAKLHQALKDPQLAAADLNDSIDLFRRLKDAISVAKCHLQAGELLDSIGRRTEAATEYHRASAIAESTNAQKAAYFQFRYALKLMELRKHEDAERVLSALANSDWLRRPQKLDVMSQLCHIAHVTDDCNAMKARSSIVLALIDESLADAITAKERRTLQIRKGAHLEMCGLHDEALQCFRKAQERCEETGDTSGIAECLFQIRGVMQKLGDRRGEREASERLLALDENQVDRLWTALTLVTLAQLNIADQRFSEARTQLDRAEALAPDNPVVALVGGQIRSTLPRISLQSAQGAAGVCRLPTKDIQALVQELHAWCDCYPQMRASIVSVWYYIHRTDLQELFRSMLGVKFLVCASDPTTFEAVEASLRGHGDMFVWGTNFALKTEDTVDIIPVPEGFVFPAGVLVVTASHADSNVAVRGSADRFQSPLFRRQSKGRLDEAYYLFYMETPGRAHEGVSTTTRIMRRVAACLHAGLSVPPRSPRRSHPWKVGLIRLPWRFSTTCEASPAPGPVPELSEHILRPRDPKLWPWLSGLAHPHREV